MSTEIKAYVTYVKTSFSDVVKAIILVVLISAGPLLAVILRVGGADGYTVLYVAVIAEIITFIVLYVLGKKGSLFKNIRQEDFKKSSKKGQKEEEQKGEE
jgi:amino acid permease